MKKILLLILFSFLILPTTTSFTDANQERTEQKMVIQKEVSLLTQDQLCINKVFELDDYDLQLVNHNSYSTPLKSKDKKTFFLQPDEFRSNYLNDTNRIAPFENYILFQKDLVLPLPRYVPFHVS